MILARSGPHHSQQLNGSLLIVRLSLVLAICSVEKISAQVVVAIGQNFTASTFNVDSSSVPPDPNGAAGPLHFVELINGRFSVFNKSNGSKVQTMSDLTFWSQAGVTIPSGWDVTDPRIIYDPVSQRWFASQVDFNLNVNTNRFLLAVSTTADPTGSWKGVAIPSDPGGNNFADFPTLGLDSQGVYLSGDMFDINSVPLGPTLVSIPKAGLLANPPTASGLTWFGIMSYNNRGDILQPAICLDGSGQGSVLAADSVGIDQSGNSVTNTLLVSFRVQNASGPGQATLTSSSFLTVPPYTVPPFPTQPDGSANLDNGDARFSAKVYELSGVLYAVHNTQVNNLCALRWYRINAATQTVLESGTISDPVKDLYYPSIAANTNGTVVIAYNGSSINTFVSGFAVVGRTIGGVTTFGNPMLLQSGIASYQNTDTTGTSRWGDYSATCVDPADPGRFWTIQEFPSSASAWSTQITELLTGYPVLSSTITANNLQLTWFGTLFNLQTTSSLATPNWTPVTQNLSTNNGLVTAQVPATSGSALFRLQAP
jgi:hypothetical protein